MFATIYLPNFYLQAALRHQPELHSKPVGLIDGKEAKALLLQLNKAAELRGVRVGMTPSQGIARCLNLIVKTRERCQENLASTILFEFAYTLAPYVEATAPGVCTIQFTDDRHLENKLSSAIQQLARARLIAQAGIAPTADASLLASHLAQPVLKIGDAKTFLAPLPIETLLDTA